MNDLFQQILYLQQLILSIKQFTLSLYTVIRLTFEPDSTPLTPLEFCNFIPIQGLYFTIFDLLRCVDVDNRITFFSVQLVTISTILVSTLSESVKIVLQFRTLSLEFFDSKSLFITELAFLFVLGFESLKLILHFRVKIIQIVIVLLFEIDNYFFFFLYLFLVFLDRLSQVAILLF